MAEIKVDIDDIIDKLNDMKEDGYETALLQIDGDEYSQEMGVFAVSFDEDEPISYGIVSESDTELF